MGTLWSSPADVSGTASLHLNPGKSWRKALVSLSGRITSHEKQMWWRRIAVILRCAFEFQWMPSRNRMSMWRLISKCRSTTLNPESEAARLLMSFASNTSYRSTSDRNRMGFRITPPLTDWDTGNAVVQMNSVSSLKRRRHVWNSSQMLRLYAFMPLGPYLHTHQVQLHTNTILS